MKLSLFLLAFVVVLSACNEDETVFVQRSASDYHPNTVGSVWSYSSAFFDFTQTISNRSKKIDGKSYFEIQVTIDEASFQAYMRKEGINYINREVYENLYDDGEYIFLKDAEVGTTWTEITNNTEIDGVPVPTTETLKILETNGTYEVEGEEFNNVIVVEVASVTGDDQEPYILFNYYAKGVGLIKVEDNKGELVTTSLLSYNIK